MTFYQRGVLNVVSILQFFSFKRASGQTKKKITLASSYLVIFKHLEFFSAWKLL